MTPWWEPVGKINDTPHMKCPTCHAAIPYGGVEGHIRWHAKMEGWATPTEGRVIIKEAGHGITDREMKDTALIIRVVKDGYGIPRQAMADALEVLLP